MKRFTKGSINVLLAACLSASVVGCSSGTNSSTTSSNTTTNTNFNSQSSTDSSSKTVTTTGIKERLIKFGSGANEDHPVGQAMKKFKEIVEEKSGGKIKVNTYFSNTLGDDQKLMESLIGGTAEMATPTTSPIVGTVKEFGVFDFPFVLNDEAEADKVLASPLGQKILDKLPEKGLVGLDYWEWGFRVLTNSKHEVSKVEDFNGLKIRTQQNPVHLDVFKALGANPTPMPFSEVFTALESHTVDGQENPIQAIESGKFHEVQTHITLTNHVYSPIVILISKKFWDQLNDEEKEIIQDTVVESGEFEKKLLREQNEKSLENIKSTGIQISEFSMEEKAKVQEMIKPILDNYAKEFGEELVNEFYQEVEKARK